MSDSPGESQIDIALQDIDLQDVDVDPASVESSARQLLALLDRDGSELSLVLCGDATIQPLNAQWRGKDAPTDVLSFPMQEGDDLLQDDPVLGDLVISVETAARQAAERGHSLEQELLVLLVHGLLHLLGHDHEDEENPAQAERMRDEELRLLALMGGGRGLVARVEA